MFSLSSVQRLLGAFVFLQHVLFYTAAEYLELRYAEQENSSRFPCPWS